MEEKLDQLISIFQTGLMADQSINIVDALSELNGHLSEIKSELVNIRNELERQSGTLDYIESNTTKE